MNCGLGRSRARREHAQLAAQVHASRRGDDHYIPRAMPLSALLLALLGVIAPQDEPPSSDPRIVLPAHAATVHGTTLRYEPEPNKNCLGYWTNAEDWAEWQFVLPRAGRFAVEVWQGCGKGHGGSDVVVAIGSARLPFVVEDTGHFQHFTPRLLGELELSAGEHSLAIKPQRKTSIAVMDVRRVRLLAIAPPPAASEAAKAWSRRVVFLGDSITYAGDWVAYAEAYLRLQDPALTFDFVNVALPSETVSGLSEPGHAGGTFPRPDLHERLARVLAKLRPAVVVACYGMNDGIYAPFAEERFAAFRAGMTRLREAVSEAGARLVHVTPPPFDPVSATESSYDDVLSRYSAWLVAQRAQGWQVIDAHTALSTYLRDRRADDARFRLAPDGVHIDAQGHWLVAREVLAWLDVPPAALVGETFALATLGAPTAPGVLDVVRRRQNLLRDAWLTEIGHQRPGLTAGLPLAAAELAAAKLLKSLPH